MIGRAPCPECGFSAAHVKQSEKCLYRYCPECGAQYNTRGERQRADLMGKTRPIDAAGAPGEKPAPAVTPAGASAPASTATPTPSTGEGAPASDTGPSASAKAQPKRRGLFT